MPDVQRLWARGLKQGAHSPLRPWGHLREISNFFRAEAEDPIAVLHRIPQANDQVPTAAPFNCETPRAPN